MNEITSSEDIRLILLSNFQTRTMRAPATIFKDVFQNYVSYVWHLRYETHPLFMNKNLHMCNVFVVVLNQTFQSCTVKMILPRKAALCLGFNLPEVSENNQTKLLEKSTKCPVMK